MFISDFLYKNVKINGINKLRFFFAFKESIVEV